LKKPSSVGSRIRERRLFLGMRQTDLAKTIGISPAYLNLIEHDRRRIAGKLLLDIAAALKVESASLSEGAEAALLNGLLQAGAETLGTEVEQDRVEEFAGRFPGWAQLVIELHKDVGGLRQAVQTLSDRLSHDPFLSDSLHEILSSVAAIQSSASILVESNNLEREWQDRFQRNIFEDSARLSQTSQSLVSYLDPDKETETGHATPEEEFDSFLSACNYQLSEMDRGVIKASGDTEIVYTDGSLKSPAAKELALNFLERYEDVEQKLPLQSLMKFEEQGMDPLQIAATSGVSLPDLMFRLSFRSAGGSREYGYVCSDASGALLMRRPCIGFSIPRTGQACPLWPAFEAFSRPLVPQISRIRQFGRDGVSLNCLSVAVPVNDFASGQVPRYQAHMLVWRATDLGRTEVNVGVNCRICTLSDCAARREPSILTDSFDSRGLSGNS